jgi:hypothetical protein
MLADLGSCKPVGQPLDEYSKQYGLDLEAVAGLPWDLTCLATTLGVLSKVCSDAGQLKSAAALSADFQRAGGLVGKLGQLILSQAVCEVENLQAAVWVPALELTNAALGGAAVKVASWWPSAHPVTNTQ